jgi:hypothetical protein
VGLGCPKGASAQALPGLDPASGEVRIVAGTEAGDVVVIDRRGRRLARAALDSPVAGLEVILFPERKAVEILAGSADGQVFVFDGRLGIRASFNLGRDLKAVVPLTPDDRRPAFLLLSEKTLRPISYINYPLKRSRVH